VPQLGEKAVQCPLGNKRTNVVGGRGCVCLPAQCEGAEARRWQRGALCFAAQPSCPAASMPVGSEWLALSSFHVLVGVLIDGKPTNAYGRGAMPPSGGKRPMKCSKPYVLKSPGAFRRSVCVSARVWESETQERASKRPCRPRLQQYCRQTAQHT